MSRTNPDRFERLALLAHCDVCGAGVGYWCKRRLADFPSVSGVAANLHANRGRHLAEAYWQGYDDGVEAQYARSRDRMARRLAPTTAGEGERGEGC